MKKILHVVGFLGNGGDTTAILNVLNAQENGNEQFMFDFITHDGCDLELVEKLRKKGSNIFILEGDVRKIGVLKYYRLILSILKNNKYDIIHFHTSFQSCVGLYAAKKCNVNTRICHSHTSDVQRKCSKLKKIIYLPICKLLINRYSTKLVACSKVAADNLFFQNADVDMLYNGLDIQKYKTIDKNEVDHIRKKYGISDSKIVVGQVGRFNDMKNFEYTIDLAKKLDSDKYLFILIGSGPLFNNLEKKVIDESINNVVFTGKVKNVNDYMSLFDCHLLPSKYGEGLPVVLIEQQIVNDKCICIANDNVSKEANLGNVSYISINDDAKWISTIKECKNKKTKSICYDNFDIKNTAIKWLSIYN